jgi:hypothetical protein
LQGIEINMKKCPSCGRSYADDALNFCLQDGSVLEQEIVSTFGNEETVFIGNPQRTDPHRGPQSGQVNVPNTWASPYTPQQPQKRKSRAWLWILLSIVALGLIGFVGFFAFLIYLGMKMEQQDAANRAGINASNDKKWPANTSKPKTGDDVKTADFSLWKTGDFDYAKVEYKGGALIVSSVKSDYFSVITGAKDFLSNDTITKLTVKNTTGAATSLGFGVMVHSNPIKALLKDYAFLIRTDGNPSYRIVQHTLSQEKELVKWTPSSAIKNGTAENDLKVVDDGKSITFYINGTLIRAINDENGDSTSIAGIYAGNAVPIAFSDFEVGGDK